MPMNVVDVGWEIARDLRFQNIVQQGTALARPELGHSVHVEVAGLEPGREYWYRFHAGDEVSQTGRTRTAPGAGLPVDRLRFAVCGCQHYEDGYFTAFRRMAEEQFDFIFHTGDYIYEGRADGGKNDRRFRQHNGDEIYTLTDYRNRYALYKSDRDLIAAHASAPWVGTWDDHEVDNNYAGDIDENNTPAELFVLRRAAAYQAYYEAMPLRASALPSGSHMRIYRRLQFGNLIDLSVLDTRQWRSDQPCGDGSRTNCAGRLAATQTMMGAEQEKWLFDNLGTVKARWTVIGQQVYSFAYDRARANPDGQFSMDKWGRLRGGAAAVVQPAPRDARAESDRALRRRASALRRGPEDRLHRSAVGDGRDRVHQHLDYDHRRRQRCRNPLGSDESRQPAHQVPQQPPRLHRLHRDARADASRFQDPREGERARSTRPNRRLARRPGGTARQQHRLRRIRTSFSARRCTGSGR